MTASDRIRAVLSAHGITREAVQARVAREYKQGGKPPVVDFNARVQGASITAAMLEMLAEAKEPT
jgi:hypothetical protein